MKKSLRVTSRASGNWVINLFNYICTWKSNIISAMAAGFEQQEHYLVDSSELELVLCHIAHGVTNKQ